MTNKKVFFCACGSNDHQIVVDGDEDYIYISACLSDNLSFWKRAHRGILYIFGYRSRHGMFSEVLLDKNSTYELITTLQSHNAI